MAAAAPSADGLAAYSCYAQLTEGALDVEVARALALLGAKLGDRLSKKILTVFYAWNLFPGKIAEALC